jgi:hypothetical protein
VNERYIEHAKKLMGEIFEDNQTLAVVGWILRNHNQFTKRIPENKVIFFEKQPHAMPKHVGLVITTRFISHSGLSSLVDNNDSYKLIRGVFSIGEIKKILLEFDLVPEKTIGTPSQNSQHQVPMPKEEEPSSISKLSESPQESEALHQNPKPLEVDGHSLNAKNTIDFSIDFLKAYNRQSETAVGRNETSTLIRKHFGESAKPTDCTQLIVAYKNPGQKRTSGYLPTDQLIDLGTGANVEPSDPFEKVSWLINREFGLKEELAFLQIRAKEIESLLARTQIAREMVEKLKNV